VAQFAVDREQTRKTNIFWFESAFILVLCDK
jgi:hypothetical protein